MLGIIEVLLFLCIVAYFFNKERAIDMVDIISNRVQEAYGSFRLPNVFGPGTDTDQNGGFSTYSILRRFGEAGRQQRQLNKQNERQMRQQSLFHIKEKPIQQMQPDLKPIPGMACPHCSPTESIPACHLKGFDTSTTLHTRRRCKSKRDGHHMSGMQMATTLNMSVPLEHRLPSDRRSTHSGRSTHIKYTHKCIGSVQNG